MMRGGKFDRCQAGLAAVLGTIAVLAAQSGAEIMTSSGASAIAQIAPDSSLGTERSQLTPSNNIRGLPGILIQGGAVRGANLFQSFSEFNVGEGQRVYFANPTGIQNILTRVTGGNPSNILGTLGVDGSANLFLLNPNGILFGRNARLDIAGSFVASTTDSLIFENGLQFSATNPEAPPLLTINLRPGLQYGTNYRGSITNAGDLAVGAGQTLVLAGNTVVHTGSLTASGGTVQVLGDRISLLDNARIDVSGIGGGGTVLIGGDFQGNGQVPNATQTFIGPNVLITADGISSPTPHSPLPTPAHGGQVIIWANDSTRFDGTISAQGGASGGNGGFVEVSGKQTLSFNGQVNTNALNGSPGQLLLDPFDLEINQPFISAGEVRFQADNNITFNAPVQITGLGEGLSAVAGNSIFVNSNIETNGGTIALEAQNGEITVRNVELNTCPSRDCGTSAFITLDARKQIRVDNSNLLSRSSNDQLFDDGELRAILIVSREGSVLLNRTGISTTNNGTGDAGLVFITALDTVEIRDSIGEDRLTLPGIFSRGNKGGVIIGGTNTLTSFPTPRNIRIINSRINVDNDTGGSATVDSGVISLRATNSIVLDKGSRVSSSTFRNGDAGGVILQTNGSVSINDRSRIFTNVESGGTGDAGVVLVQAGSVSVSNDSAITASTFGNGDAVGVVIVAKDDVSVKNGSRILSAVGKDGNGDAGGVIIRAENLLLDNESFLTTETTGQGDAGVIRVTVDKLISVKNGSGIFSTVAEGLAQNAGDIFLTARSIHVRNDSQINVENDGLNPPGDVGGDIFISAKGVWLDNRGFISASTFLGKGGEIFLDVPGAVILGRNSSIFASATVELAAEEGEQAGGNIAIGSGNLRRFLAFKQGVLFRGFEFDQPTLLIAGKTPRDNDIRARGFVASGGVIRINAFRLQDIAERPDITPTTNDISTRSFFDVDGTTVVNALDVFPSFRADPLPDRYTPPRIAEGCDPRARQETSRFIITGRGGLPADPSEVLTPNTIIGPSTAPSVELPPPSADPTAIAPARGWVKNADGTLRLTAYATNPNDSITPYLFWSNPEACYTNSPKR